MVGNFCCQRGRPPHVCFTVKRLELHALAFVAALLACGAIAPAALAFGLVTGFNSDPVLTNDGAASRAIWIPRAVSAGAGLIRVNVTWSAVAPQTRPTGFSAANPASPGYDWSGVDGTIRDLTAHRLQVMLSISGAPNWAEGAQQPANVDAGTWKPDPSQFAQFAEAAARRYDGHFPDPVHPGAVLPRVRYWQAWNEPNLDTYLTPQWTSTGHGFTPASPAIYRSMLNAFYAAVKGVARSNVVVTAGMAPYGNPPGVNTPGGYRMQPVAFDRALFSKRVYLDVLAQHTYPVEGPLWHALNADDVAVADLYKVRNVLHAAERAGDALPRGPKQLWVTELGWDSDPPNPEGVPVAEQARWYEQALYLLWRQGVDTALFLQLVDSPPIPSYFVAYEEGLYYLSGSPKPAATAFRFPFVTNRLDRAHIQVWGRAPVGGQLALQRRRGARWVVIARFRVKRHQVFSKKIALRGQATLRALVGGQISLPWTQSA